MNLRTMFSAAILVAVGTTAVMADAVPYPHTGQYAPANAFTATAPGDIVGYFFGSTAAYESEIGVFADGVQVGPYALDNHHSGFAQRFDFGHVDAGDSITFSLDVLTKGYVLSSDYRLNPDETNHVYTTHFSGNRFIPAGTFVSFEDLIQNSDLNYNDMDVVFTNVTTTATPEPTSIALLGLGLLPFGIAGLRKRRKLASKS
jgi:hypothetical protein